MSNEIKQISQEENGDIINFLKNYRDVDITKYKNYTVMVNNYWIGPKIKILHYLQDRLDFDLFLLICAKFSLIYSYIKENKDVDELKFILSFKEINQMIFSRYKNYKKYSKEELLRQLKNSFSLLMSTPEEIEYTAEGYKIKTWQHLFKKIHFIETINLNPNDSEYNPFFFLEFSLESFKKLNYFNSLINLDNILNLDDRMSKILYLMAAENRGKEYFDVDKNTLINKYLPLGYTFKTNRILNSLENALEKCEEEKIISIDFALEPNKNSKQALQSTKIYCKLIDKVNFSLLKR